MKKQLTKYSMITLCALACASILNVSCTNNDSQMSDWQQQVEADLGSLEHDFKELKAELQGDDLEASKQEALSEAEEMKTDIENKLKQAKHATKEEAIELKKEIQTAMSDLKKKMSSKN